jgi:hypothetical protein
MTVPFKRSHRGEEAPDSHNSPIEGNTVCSRSKTLGIDNVNPGNRLELDEDRNHLNEIPECTSRVDGNVNDLNQIC